MANELGRVAPPVIPYAQPEYDANTQVQTNSILRLFFNRLLALVDGLLSAEQGGKYLYMPNALFYSTTEQTLAAINTGYPVEFEVTYQANGITIVDDTKITVDSDGIYNFQVSLQVESSDASAKNVWVWINKNGTDVPYGSHEYSLAGSGEKIVVVWNFSIDVMAGEYIQMYWGADDTNVVLHSHVASTPHPGAPSTVVSVSFVSNV